MKKTGNYLFFFVLLLVAPTVMALEVAVEATSDKTTVAVGEPFTVTVSVRTSERVELSEPRFPTLNGIDLRNQWDSSSVRSQFINGQMSTQIMKGFNYSMVAAQEGTLSIGAFEVVVEGQVYRTQPILMKVVPVGSAPQQGQRRQAPQWPGMGDEESDPFQQLEEEMFNQLLQRRGLMPRGTTPPGGQQQPQQHLRPQVDPQFRSLPTNPDDAFFIQVEVDKTEVYENEQITVSWYLYTRGQLESLDRVKFPDLKGFWKEIIEEIPQLQFSEEIINGVVYRKALLASHALFPIKAGTSYVDEYKIKSRVRMLPQGFSYGLGRSYEYSRASKRVPIKVNALPLEGRPATFSGAVGEFQVQAQIPSSSMTPKFYVNQPFSVKLRIEGSGNAKLIELPAISWPTRLEVYDTKTDAKFFKNGTSYKEFEILLIPRQKGPLQIPSISLSMFNPRTKKYETKSTAPMEMQVEENPQAPTQTQVRTSLPKASGAPAMTPVLPELVLSADGWEPALLAQSPYFLFGIYGSVMAFLLLRAQSIFQWGRRQKTQKEILNQKFKKIENLVKKNDFRNVGAEVTNAFYYTLGELSGETGGTDQLQNLMDKIPPSLRRDYANQIEKIFELFQTLTFAPEAFLVDLRKPENLKMNVRQAKELMLKLVESQMTQGEEV